jgi:salicylate hydroxylase
MVVLMEVPFDATHSNDTVQTPLQQTWHEQVPFELSHWHFSQALMGASPDLHDLFRAVGEWSPWRLFDTNPLKGAHELARGRLALLGDAGHAMLPFLAQGAGMSIEDADALANAWSHEEQAVTLRLENYAQSRWRRNARVQRRAQTNASVFHAKGAFAGVRDLGLSLLGERLLDMPWLYGHR